MRNHVATIRTISMKFTENSVSNLQWVMLILEPFLWLHETKDEQTIDFLQHSNIIGCFTKKS